MKKLFLTLIAAGALFLTPLVSQAQTFAKSGNQTGTSTELLQISDQLNKLAIHLGQVADALDVHLNSDVDVKDSQLSKKINELQKNLEKTTRKIEKIQKDRNIHTAPETDEDEDEELLDTV